MKQVMRRVLDRSGRIAMIDLPEPHVGSDQVLVQNHYSLISSGTELNTLAKTPIELAKQTISDPWMRHVVKDTVLATGIGQTARRVLQEMVRPREIGYSGAGRVIAVGDRVEGISLGDFVAYAASGHAELVAPHINHVVRIPPSLDMKQAAFVTLGGIVIHSLRRAEIQFGERVAVIGLGLVGQICALVAKAAGAVVVGIDIDDDRNRLGRELGLDLVINPAESDLSRRLMDFTEKHGVDATIICAQSSSNEVINRAMEITRKQGRVVLVGYVKLEIHPKAFLYNEIDLRYSRAFGPGSYHRAYEQGRVDYPFAYVRWTEKRNMEEFIRLLASGSVSVEPLIGGVYPVDRAQEAFDAVRNGTIDGVAAVIEYDVESEPDRRRSIEVRPHPKVQGKVGIGIIGCGNHVLGKHLPSLGAIRDVDIRGLASATGRNASMVAKKVNATVITTDVDDLLTDSDTDAVLICSSQPEHFDHIRKVVAAGKAVYVEKPMVTRLDHFAEIVRLMDGNPVLFTLGLNRRYSPLIAKLREVLEGPVQSVTYSIAQPFTPPDHWTLDEVEGAGRLITEGEHFIDICNLLIGEDPQSVYAKAIGNPPDDLRRLCNFSVTVHYERAVAHIVFNESGSKGFPRERIQVFAAGQIALLDDYSRLVVHHKKQRSFGGGRRRQMGHRQALSNFIAAVRGEPNRVLSWTEAFNATLTMFAAQESIRSGEPIDLRRFQHELTEPDE